MCEGASIRRLPLGFTILPLASLAGALWHWRHDLTRIGAMSLRKSTPAAAGRAKDSKNEAVRNMGRRAVVRVQFSVAGMSRRSKGRTEIRRVAPQPLT